MELLKDLLIPKCFNICGYVVALLYLVIGVTFTGITGHLKSGEKERFKCKQVAFHQKFLEAECFTKYQQVFNSPLPLYGFVLMTFGAVIVVCVVYSFFLKGRIEEIERMTAAKDELSSMDEEGSAGDKEKFIKRQKSRHIFWSYVVHLTVRFAFGLIFTVLQYELFYPLGFQSDFVCTLPSDKFTTKTNRFDKNSSSTSTDCHNSLASEKNFWSNTVSAVNIFFALLALVELVYLAKTVRRSTLGTRFANDLEFCQVYLFRKKDRRELRARSDDKAMDTMDNDLQVYRSLVLDDTIQPESSNRKRNSSDSGDMKLIILKERVNDHKDLLEENLPDVYKILLKNSIIIDDLKEIFLPNEDTNNKPPRTIILFSDHETKITPLSREILRQWAEEGDEIYAEKIAILVRCEWFNQVGVPRVNLCVKELLRRSIQLGHDEFEKVYRQITKQPEKLILIFDGLHKLEIGRHGNVFTQEAMTPNAVDEDMPIISIFVKLVSGKLLRGATILATTQLWRSSKIIILDELPNGFLIYSGLKFDREILMLEKNYCELAK